MNNCRIGLDKVKFAILQGGVAFVFAFCLPWLLGGEIPIKFRLVFATFGALMFAGFALITAWLLAYRLEGDYLENAFPGLGRGRVNLNDAKLARFPAPVLFLVLDEKTHNKVLLPRPFWSNNPKLAMEILRRLKGVA